MNKEKGMNRSILQCQQLSKTYTEGPNDVAVLQDANLDVAVGERIAIIGASGSGKSTLLHLLGGLDLPSAGSVLIEDQEFSSMSDRKRGDLRNQYLGFVYQFHHLLPEFTAVDNVAMPLLIRGEDAKQSRAKAADILSEMGLSNRLEHRPVELSGGERQRAAIARALVSEPKVVLADEPTGNLDEKTADAVFSMMMDLNQRIGTALIMVTHDNQLAARMDTIYQLEMGQLAKQ